MVHSRISSLVSRPVPNRLERFGGQSSQRHIAKRYFHVVWAKPHLALVDTDGAWYRLLYNSCNYGETHRQVLLSHFRLLVHCCSRTLVSRSPSRRWSGPEVDPGSWDGHEYCNDLPHRSCIHKFSCNRLQEHR